MFAFQLGSAFKPSTLGPDKLENLKFLAKIMARLGYRYLVVDSEREKDDFTVSDFANLVAMCGRWGFPEPVLTIPVRRNDVWNRLSECIEVLNGSGFGGVCLVAGNPAYLTDDEKRNKSSELMIQTAQQFRRRCRFNTLMVGTENIAKTAAKIAFEHRAVPVMLLTPAVSDESKLFSGDGLLKAVYAPFVFGQDLPQKVTERIDSYVRRRCGENSREIWRNYVLFGGLRDFTEKMKELVGSSVDIVIGHPFENNPSQLKAFAKSVSSGPSAPF